ncbi:MAG TPA: hypothetical protein DCZ41_04885 [Firmicutes bacterium]|nr:hypothetical protein [Bacillota bacterium]
MPAIIENPFYLRFLLFQEGDEKKGTPFASILVFWKIKSDKRHNSAATIAFSRLDSPNKKVCNHLFLIAFWANTNKVDKRQAGVYIQT